MDETTKDVVQPEGGGQETPTPEASPPATEQGSPSGESQLEAALKKINELDGQVRALQSDKDRGVARVSKEVKDLSKQIERYEQWKELGKSKEEALRELQIDELLASSQPESAEVPPKEEPAVQPKAAGEEYLNPYLESLGLEDSDPDVIDILRKNRDPASRIIAMSELSKSRKQAQAPPNPAAVQPTGAGGAVQPETLESVTEQLNRELAKPASPETRARIRELGKKQKELLPKK